METKILRKLFLGFVQVHILYHAGREPVFGGWLLEELKRHGYNLSPGTLYPLLHELERSGLLARQDCLAAGRLRKFYSTTARGDRLLEEARLRAVELVRELEES